LLLLLLLLLLLQLQQLLLLQLLVVVFVTLPYSSCMDALRNAKPADAGRDTCMQYNTI
jgi:hypothetical protein